LKSSSTYECTQNQCTQLFQNLNSFKKHTIKKHPIINSNTTNSSNINNDINTSLEVQNCTTQNLNAVDRMSHENESIQNNDSIPQKNHYNNCISLDTALTSFQDSALKFTISLISNSNFSRKNAFDIQRGIEESLIKPMVNLLNEFLKDTIKMPAMLSQFNKITSILSNPFEWCNSEYKLNNWLSENNLYEEARQFTINSETNLVYNSGEKIYGDNIAKGVLLPIKFQLKKYFEYNNNNNLNISLLNYEYLMSTSGDNLIKHFVHGKQWKEKVSLFNNKIVIPYFMYIDDFEINNQLGSHASVQSLAAIYYSFPLLDQSKLNTITFI